MGKDTKDSDAPLPGSPGLAGEAAPTPLPLEAKLQGIILLPRGGGSGTGGAGSGAGDHGTGVGGGGSGQGGRADGADKSGGAGRGRGVGGGLASRSGGRGDGIADLLRAIRRRIEEAKTYPDAARRGGMEGTVEVRFQIDRDGQPEGLEIVRSSGHPELDEIAMQTIRRAGPYPAVSGRIRIPLSYRLDR